MWQLLICAEALFPVDIEKLTEGDGFFLRFLYFIVGIFQLCIYFTGVSGTVYFKLKLD